MVCWLAFVNDAQHKLPCVRVLADQEFTVLVWFQFACVRKWDAQSVTHRQSPTPPPCWLRPQSRVSVYKCMDLGSACRTCPWLLCYIGRTSAMSGARHGRTMHSNLAGGVRGHTHARTHARTLARMCTHFARLKEFLLDIIKATRAQTLDLCLTHTYTHMQTCLNRHLSSGPTFRILPRDRPLLPTGRHRERERERGSSVMLCSQAVCPMRHSQMWAALLNKKDQTTTHKSKRRYFFGTKSAINRPPFF